MHHVIITCDGSGTTSGRPMGFAAILRCESLNLCREIVGGAEDGTNNRAEVSAAILGLSALKSRCSVTVRSDSEYLVLGITEGRAVRWRARGWKKRDRVCAQPAQRPKHAAPPFTATGGMRPVANADLWAQLLELIERHECDFQWVRGHDGDEDNERADKLAGMERARRIAARDIARIEKELEEATR